MAFVPWRPRTVKGNGRNYSRIPLYINSGNQLWSFPYGTLKRQYPGLLSMFQRSGNRFLDPTNPSTVFNPTIQTFPQIQGQQNAWDVLMSIIGRNGSWSFQNGINGQTDHFEKLFDLLRQASIGIRSGFTTNGMNWLQNLVSALQAVDDLSWVIGMNGAGIGGTTGFAFGSGMYQDLLDLGRNFVTILGSISPVDTFQLLESLMRVFGNDTNVLIDFLGNLSPLAQADLKRVANSTWQNEGNILGQFIDTVL